MIVLLLLCIVACVLVGAALTARMFRRGDDFAGLLALCAFITSACFAVVFGSEIS